MSSLAHILPLERSRWFNDGDATATTKRSDEVVTVPVDWSDQLASGVTISSVAYVDSGVTRTSTSNTTTTTTTHVTGIGEFEVTVTLSNSDTIQRVFRFYDADRRRVTDYGVRV